MQIKPKLSSGLNVHQLQQRLIFCSALGILTTSLIVAFVSIVPLYKQLKKQEERNLQFALKTRSLAVEQFLDRTRDVAVQISSRTQARQELESYNQKQIGLAEYTKVSTNLVEEALIKSTDVVGISRLDRTGQLVIKVGQSIPAEFWNLPAPNSKKALVGSPVKIKNEFYLTVASPILNPELSRIGTGECQFCKISRSWYNIMLNSSKPDL